MARSIPKARDGSLHQHTAEGTSLDPIRIGTAEWYSWLEQHRSFGFEARRMTFTARKEQRPGGWYWYAYRRSQGKLHSVYLGKSEELTLERRSEEHTSELQSPDHLVCRLLLEKKKSTRLNSSHHIISYAVL